jgi:hypothetical protein
MSDLPPEGSNPQQPAGSTETPSPMPQWAVPAVPPSTSSPAIEAWANDPAVAQVPPRWAGPVAGSAVAVGAPDLAASPDLAAVTPDKDPAPGVVPTTVLPAAVVLSPVPNPPAGWYMPVTAPAVAPAVAARAPMFSRDRWLPTVVVAAILAVVTLGGIGLDKVIAAPSAGTVAVGGSVTITAASGWVLISPAGDTSQGIQLQKGNAVLTAQLISSSYRGTSAAMVSDAEQSLGGNSAQVSYGDAHHGAISGHDTTYVTFEAAMTSGTQSGIVDGELVCMVVGSNEVILVAAAPQGDLEPAIDDVSAMLKSVRAGQ